MPTVHLAAAGLILVLLSYPFPRLTAGFAFMMAGINLAQLIIVLHERRSLTLVLVWIALTAIQFGIATALLLRAR